MGTLTGLQIYRMAAEVLEDTAYVTYLEANLLDWVNDAQRTITLIRPDAKTAREAFQLAAQTRQTLPTGARRLGGVIRNLGEDGATPGRAITGPVPREPLDAVDPTWSTTTGEYVRQYVYEEDAPQYFDIYPYVATDWYVEIKVYRTPTDLADSGDTIDLDDIYAPVIREWLLYNCFARDSERSPNWTRAGRHFAAVFQLLGVKTRADLAVSPKVVERDRQLEVQR